LAWSETEREKLRQTFAPPVQISAAPVAQSTIEGDGRKRA
jgi:hypothetical protein